MHHMNQSMPAVEWHPFDRDDDSTAPKHHNLVWIVEQMHAGGVDLAYYTGWFVTPYGSDDLDVAYWAEITYPEPPAARFAASCTPSVLASRRIYTTPWRPAG